MKDTDKVTLTVGQLKRLIKESRIIKEGYDYKWSILTATKKYGVWEGSDSDIATSDDYFDSINSAKKDAMIWLRDEIKTPGDYMIQVSRGWDVVWSRTIHLASYGKMFWWD